MLFSGGSPSPLVDIFQDVDIPQGNLLGKEGEGFKIAMEILDAGRIPVAAQVSSLASKIKLSLSQQPI